MRNNSGDVIYIGKAVNLRARVSSYFNRRRTGSPWVASMVEHIDDFECILTDTEVEALVLEANLIKKHRPRYNILLKDDKTYPWIKVTVKDDFPRVFPTRSFVNDGSRYFGPYTSARSMRNTLKVVKRIFPIRECRHSKPGKTSGRVCLNYHIDRCLGPCTGKVSSESYREMIYTVMLFLRGRSAEVLQRMEKNMQVAVDQLQYEKAAVCRDRKREIERILVRQHVYLPGGDIIDVISLESSETHFCVSLFKVREGKILDRSRMFGRLCGRRDNAEIITGFMKQYYLMVDDIPPEILISHIPEDLCSIEEWLRTKAGRKVLVHLPRRGPRKALLELARTDSIHAIGRGIVESDKMIRSKDLLPAVKSALELTHIPHRIYGYDISNLGESNAVASQVVFVDGVPDKKSYRRYRMRGVNRQDDFAMMGEVISRSFLNVKAGEIEKPDLVIVDGGRGHLNVVLEQLQKMDVAEQDVCAISKGEEKLYLAKNPEPLLLRKDSTVLQLIQRVRDESHRFARSYHMRLRRREMLRSVLDDVPEIGVKRKHEILREFESVQELEKASQERLSKLRSIGVKTARDIYNYFHPATNSAQE
jgi:excinuclease ABC subunit C